MHRFGALPLVAAVLAACASAAHSDVGPCTSECTLEVTNATPFDVNLRVTGLVSRSPVDETIASGETKVFGFAGPRAPALGITGLRSRRPQGQPGTLVRVQCSPPARSGDTFRSSCRVTGERRVPGDEPADRGPWRAVQ